MSAGSGREGTARDQRSKAHRCFGPTAPCWPGTGPGCRFWNHPDITGGLLGRGCLRNLTPSQNGPVSSASIQEGKCANSGQRAQQALQWAPPNAGRTAPAGSDCLPWGSTSSWLKAHPWLTGHTPPPHSLLSGQRCPSSSPLTHFRLHRSVGCTWCLSLHTWHDTPQLSRSRGDGNLPRGRREPSKNFLAQFRTVCRTVGVRDFLPLPERGGGGGKKVVFVFFFN